MAETFAHEIEQHKWVAIGGAAVLGFAMLAFYLRKQNAATQGEIGQLESAITSGSLNPYQYSPYGSSLSAPASESGGFQPSPIFTPGSSVNNSGSGTSVGGSGTPSTQDSAFDAAMAALATPPAPDNSGQIAALQSQLTSAQNQAAAADQAATAAKQAQDQAAKLAAMQVANAQTQSNALQTVINSTSFNSEVSQASAALENAGELFNSSSYRPPPNVTPQQIINAAANLPPNLPLATHSSFAGNLFSGGGN